MPIFDQGYQHWSGTLSSHSMRWWAITRHGVRVGLRSWIVRIALLLSWIPAGFLAFFLSIWGLLERKSELVAPLLPLLGFLDPAVLENPQNYRVEFWTLCFDQFLAFELFFSMVMVLIIGPSLISQDLRFNAMPLYFSRPMRRIDYFVGKLGIIAAFLGLVLVVPSLMAYVLGLLFSLDLTILRDTLLLLLSCIAYGVVIVLSAGTLMLALSSLSRNSRFVALFWLGLWFVSSIVGAVLKTVDTEQRRHAHFRRVYEAENAEPMAIPTNRDEQRQQQQARREQRRNIEEEFSANELKSAKSNWRPLLSYAGNLSRIGQALLNTDASWRRLAESRPENNRQRFMLENMGPQYPWYWSAITLAGLFGLSVVVLNFRIRSLDRLK